MSYNQRSKIFTILLLFFLNHQLTAQCNTIESVNTMNDTIRVTDTLLTTTPSVALSNFNVDGSYTLAINRDNFRLNTANVNIYDLPYSMSRNFPNYKRLGINTGVLFTAGVTMLGVLYALPEGATAWNKKEMRETPLFKRWWKNVKAGPVVDKDSFVFNYILHPYGGAAYYMGARSTGLNMWYSALYCTFISTVFWEYGIEAFMEIPSIQDLVITPIVGSALGECFYLAKRHIVANDHHLLGSKLLGNIAVYLLDPVNEVIGIFAGNPTRQKNGKNKRAELACTPYFNPIGVNASVGLNLAIRF